MRLPLSRACVFAFLAVAASIANAQGDAGTPDSEPERLTIATKIAPPYAMKHPDGAWHGLSIGLWEAIARDLDLDFDYREMTIPEMLDALESGEVDAGVAALTITPEREERIDFTHPFQVAGLGVAVRNQGFIGRTIGLVRGLLSPTFWTATISLTLLLLIVGGLMWFVERKKNHEQFGGSVRSGLGSGLWWSAVTMTTVGYGDKAPITPAGRMIGLVWMFAGIIVISGFTAAFASSLTLGGLRDDIRSARDLADKRIGAAEGATSEAFLLSRGTSVRPFATVEAAVDALVDDDLDAVVHDRPILRYMVGEGGAEGVHMLDLEFERQDYGIALPEGSPLRERVNRALLEYIGSDQWREQQTRYLGGDD